LVLDSLVNRAARKALLAGGAVVVACMVGAWLCHPEIYHHYRHAGWRTSGAANFSPKDWIQPIFSYWFRMYTAADTFAVQFIPTALAALFTMVYWWKKRYAWDWARELPRLIFVSTIACAYGAWIFDLVVLLAALTPTVVALANHPNPKYLKRFATLFYLVVFCFVVVPTLFLKDLTGYSAGLHYYIWVTPFCLGMAWAVGRWTGMESTGEEHADALVLSTDPTLTPLPPAPKHSEAYA
jgi:hypothetical protein